MIWEIVQRAFASLRKAAMIEHPPLFINEDGLLEGEGVEHVLSHPSWRYSRLSTADGNPKAIVAHCSDTALGTAVVMANKRTKPRTPADRAASWHASIEDATIVQMASFEAGCWHAEDNVIKGVGAANRTALGFEMIGKPAGPWTEGQIINAMRLWRATVRSYHIPRSVAMIAHSTLAPHKRSDPGKLFMSTYAQAILDYAYAA